MGNFIAELGACHQHEVGRTKELILDLLECGVDIIKFQYWSDSVQLAEQRDFTLLAAQNYTEWATDLDFIEEMSEFISEQGGGVMCSTFLPQDAATISPFVDCFKIASLEASDIVTGKLDLFKAILKAGRGLPVYISTGHMTQPNLTNLLRLKRGEWEDLKPSAPIYLLHCTVAYPCPLEELHLSVIRNNYLDGLSDHSANILTGAIAYCCGARHFEFHVRASWTSNQNPDYLHSLTVKQVKEYISSIRATKVMLGNGVKAITKTEEQYG